MAIERTIPLNALRPTMNAIPASRAEKTAQTQAQQKAGGKPPDPELASALEEFEAMFAGMLLRTARESNESGWLGGESSAGSDGIMDFAEQHIAKAMAKQGAFGIGKTLGSSIRK